MVNLLNIIIPFYLWPGGCNQYGYKSSQCPYATYFNAIEANKGIMFTCVININSGPGAPSDFTNDWATVISQANSYNNTRVIGYIDSNVQNIPRSTYLPQLQTYAKWANNKTIDIHVDGIFVDDMDYTQKASPAYYVQYAKDIKSTLPAGTEDYIIMNPGGPIPDCAFYGNVSAIISFENYYYNWNSNYLTSYPDGFAASQYSACPRYKQTAIVHDFTGSATDQQQVSDDAGETYRLGQLFVTNWTSNNNFDTYGSVPTLFTQLASSVVATDSWISQHPQWYPNIKRRTM